MTCEAWLNLIQAVVFVAAFFVVFVWLLVRSDRKRGGD